MSADMLLAFGLLLATIVLFASDRLRMDVVALMLVLGGIYADPTHTYGLPSIVPTSILLVALLLQGLIWTAFGIHRLRTSEERGSEIASG